MNWKLGLKGLYAAMICAAGTAFAINNPEVEPNDSKAAATVANSSGIGMDVNDTITGTTTGSSTSAPGGASSDFFLVTTKAMPAAIYRYRLVLTSGAGTPAQTITIRGLSQTAGVPNAGTDVQVQVQSAAVIVANAKVIQWYGFGSQEQLYIRVTGTAASTTAYSARLERIVVAPVSAVGTIVDGSISLSRGAGNTADVDYWVYDSNYNAIADAGHDSPDPTIVSRTYAPGTYYVAWGNFNLANSLGSPADDSLRNGNVMDFANVAADSSSLAVAIMDMSINSPAGPLNVPLSRNSPLDIPWVRMVVAVNDIPTDPTCIAAASPTPVINDGTGNTTFTVTVTPGERPVGQNHTVTADLSLIGGPSDAPFTEGPQYTFSYNFTIPAGTPAGPYAIATTVEETAPLGRRTGCTANLTLTNPPMGSCCTNDGCIIVTEADCSAQMGTYNGNSTTCAGCACSGATIPVNDDIAGALLLVDAVPQTGSTCAATIDNGTTANCGPRPILTNGVWFTLPGNGNMATVATCGSGYDTVLSIYCGTPESLTCIGGNDDACALSSSFSFCTQETATYYVLVHGYVAASIGNFTVVYTDQGTPCTPTIECIPTGACCMTSGCQRLTAAVCAVAGGNYLGNGIVCGVVSDTAQNFPSADSFPVFIPDYAGGVPGMASASIVIGAGSGTVQGLKLKTAFTHTWVGDLIGTLTNGTASARIFSRNGGGNNLAGEYDFSNSAPVSFAVGAAAGTPVPAGLYSPFDSFAVFDGMPYEGTWTLTITDNAGIDVGNIEALSIQVTLFTPNCPSSNCTPCISDYNQDGGVTGDDVAAFFGDFENGLECSDVNQDGGITGEDVETFFRKFEVSEC